MDDGRGGGQSSFDHAHVESLKKNSRRDPGLSYIGGQSSFDHAHVESLKKILGEILVCHTGRVNHLLTMHMLNL